MIRSIGSSLLAKAGTGSISRKRSEETLTKPNIPGKGAVGTLGRDLIETTQIQPAAPGSEKIIRSAPGVESASLPGMVGATQQPMLSGSIGLPGGIVNKPGEASQPMFQGSSAPASQQGQAGRQAQVTSQVGAPQGAVTAAKAIRSAASQASQQAAEAAQVQAPSRKELFGMFPEAPTAIQFGSRVSADTGQPAQSSAQWSPTTGQYISGALGKAINTIGQKLGNILPEMKVSENLQKIGGSQTVAAAGKGSVTKAAQNIGSALRSVVQQAQNAWSKLRSKFGR